SVICYERTNIQDRTGILLLLLLNKRTLCGYIIQYPSSYRICVWGHCRVIVQRHYSLASAALTYANYRVLINYAPLSESCYRSYRLESCLNAARDGTK